MLFFLVLIRRPRRSTRTDTRFPDTALFPSPVPVLDIEHADFYPSHPIRQRHQVRQVLALDQLDVGGVRRRLAERGIHHLPVVTDQALDRKSTRLNSSH